MRAFATPLTRAALLLSCWFAATPAAFGGEPAHLAIVPWQVVIPGQPHRQTPLIVFWIPASAEDFHHSELLGFPPLLEYAGPCVSLLVIRQDDAERIERFGGAGKLPTVVLTSSEGVVISRVTQEKGSVTGSAVEKALRDELLLRKDSAGLDLDDAPRKLAIGDREGAIALYRRVCEQRCFLPRHAREAERALGKLGVPLVAASP